MEPRCAPASFPISGRIIELERASRRRRRWRQCARIETFQSPPPPSPEGSGELTRPDPNWADDVELARRRRLHNKRHISALLVGGARLPAGKRASEQLVHATLSLRSGAGGGGGAQPDQMGRLQLNYDAAGRRRAACDYSGRRARIRPAPGSRRLEMGGRAGGPSRAQEAN